MLFQESTATDTLFFMDFTTNPLTPLQAYAALPAGPSVLSRITVILPLPSLPAMTTTSADSELEDIPRAAEASLVEPMQRAGKGATFVLPLII